MDWRGVHRSTMASFLVMAVLLAGSAAVIYSHVDRLSKSELVNRQRLLSSAMIGFRRDFSGALFDLTRVFEPPLWTRSTEDVKTQLVERYVSLLEGGADLDLIAEMCLLVFPVRNSVEFFRFDPVNQTFQQSVAPDSLLSAIQEPNIRPPRRPGRPEPRLLLVNGEIVLALSHPTERLNPLRRRVGTSRTGPAAPPPGPAQNSRPLPEWAPQRGTGPKTFLVLLRLNRAYLKDILLPGLTESHFARPQLSGFEVAVAGEPGLDLIYRSNLQREPGFFRTGDASVPLVAHGGWLFPFNPAMQPGREGAGANVRSGTFELVARHRLGSLKTAVSRQRTYDLLKASGLLVLLAGAALTMLLSVRGARRLAKKQMNFVAGISHELRSPLTAIKSAGFNLSTGTVRDGNKIRDYGRLIIRESRRLSRMVEQVLSYAGALDSKDHYVFEIVQPEEILEAVLQEMAPVLEEEGWKIETDVEEELPSLYADLHALKSCLRNLIDNATKYAAERRCLTVRLSVGKESRREWVLISIQDQGPGIADAELSHIFEPFYRGANHVATPNPGTGLGLALVKRHVEAHGGKIRVASNVGVGSEFRLYLPPAPSAQPSDKKI